MARRPPFTVPENPQLDLLPGSISTLASFLLVAMSFIGSFITAAMGIGGGIVLIAVMATVMPAPAVIPVHGVVQLGANVGRAGMQRAHIDWRTFLYFGAGSIVGITIGGSVVVTLPADILRLGLALFILYAVWGPKMRFVSQGQTVVVAMGVAASFLTMFFGATGTFISSVLNQRDYSPRELVGTHSICMGAQHGLKIIVFGILGFAFADWLGLMALMLFAAFAGTYLGSLVLNRLPAKVFSTGLKVVLTLLALNLLASAFGLYSMV